MKQKRSELRTLLIIAFAVAMTALAGLFVSEAKAQPAANGKAAKPTPAKQESAGPALSIDDFLQQVVKGNDAYRAAELNRQAANGYADEATLTLSPSLFANAQQTSDAKPSPLFRYDRQEVGTYSIGVAKQFSMGLQAKVGYGFGDTEIVGVVPKYYEARPQVEATLPLWRNLWGKETMGTVDANRLGALAKAKSQEAAAKNALIDAEMAYWRLALARESLKVSRESLTRAESMMSWTNRRVNLELSDRAENLQSSAQLKARKLDLIQAEDNERSARLAFNAARGIASDKVTEELTVLNADLVSKWQTPTRMQNRPDIDAARLQAEAAEANARAAGERSKPTLEAYGLYALNSPTRNNQSDAFTDSIKRDRPTSTVGLRMNIPLDFGTTSRAQEGWNAEASASRYLVARKNFEQERDWNDITARFQLAKEKVRLYEELEVAQRDKLENERTRQKSGRTTLAQVIIFEGDFDQTRFARLSSLAEILTLNAQMKLYGVAYDNAAGSGATPNP